MNAMQEAVEKDNLTTKISHIEGINMQSLSDYMVMMYNNEVTDGKDVVEVLMRECGYPEDVAISYVFKVHNSGKHIVFWGKKEHCESLVGALAKIMVKGEVLKNE